MAKPMPWSHSRLEQFANCPWAFFRLEVKRDIKKVQGKEASWGEWVHEQFRYRANHPGYELPAELSQHEPHMKRLDAREGVLATELKVGLTRELQPCDFMSQDIWWRGIIDWRKISGKQAQLEDYKTGKPHMKFSQLAEFALFTFYEHPEVNLVDAQYYWTVDCTSTRRVWSRKEIPLLWAMFQADLKQYKIAFQTETWQKRPSGLCAGYCAVKDCEYWKPRRT